MRLFAPPVNRPWIARMRVDCLLLHLVERQLVTKYSCSNSIDLRSMNGPPHDHTQAQSFVRPRPLRICLKSSSSARYLPRFELCTDKTITKSCKTAHRNRTISRKTLGFRPPELATEIFRRGAINNLPNRADHGSPAPHLVRPRCFQIRTESNKSDPNRPE